MAIQTSIDYRFDKAVPGLLFGFEGKAISTGVANESLGFGRGVVLDGAVLDMGRLPLKAPTANTDVFVGVTVLEHVEPTGSRANEVAQFEENDTVPVLQDGKIWVPVTTAFSLGDSVYLIVSGADAGKFRATADGTNTLEIDAEWVTPVTQYNGENIAVINLK